MDIFEWVILAVTAFLGFYVYCLLASKPRETDAEYAERIERERKAARRRDDDEYYEYRRQNNF
jgi:uncharacterized membrane protein